MNNQPQPQQPNPTPQSASGTSPVLDGVIQPSTPPAPSPSVTPAPPVAPPPVRSEPAAVTPQINTGATQEVGPVVEERSHKMLFILLGLLVVLIAIAAGIWYFGYYQANTNVAVSPTPAAGAIDITDKVITPTGQATATASPGLDALSNELDATNPDDVTTELKDNDTDAASF